MGSVLLLLGKPPERSPVLPGVLRCLRGRGATVRVVVPRRGEPLPRDLAGYDVVALRGLHRQTLEALLPTERAGLVRFCNPAAATLLLLDRSVVHERLVAAGTPVPAATSVARPEDARGWAGDEPMVVKARATDLRPRAPVVTWWYPGVDGPPTVPGPCLVQRRVAGDGVDRKLYVIGDAVAGLLKPEGTGRRGGSPFTPDDRLDALARAVGRTLDLRVYGVDVVAGSDGPVVVDVNAFPSCHGVRGAAALIADVLFREGQAAPST